MTRPVHQAMDARRADKQAVRKLWCEVVEWASEQAGDDDTPLYLTLPGALGLDIEVLVEAGLVRRAENRAIAAGDVWKVVAVESSGSAALELKKRFVGLRVLNQDILNVLRSTGPLTWPDGKDEAYCRARVVNLDLNAGLRVERDAGGHFVFPTIQLIWKLAQLHLKEPALDWVLCLTVAATVVWPADAALQVQQFLAENFAREEAFAADSRRVLSDELFERIAGEDPVDFAVLEPAEQQALLMVFVPKKIVSDTYMQGWRITTSSNLRYGGQQGVAPLVTFVMRFERDARVAGRPRVVYSESLGAALTDAGAISSTGRVTTIS